MRLNLASEQVSEIRIIINTKKSLINNECLIKT